jgi:hypothetical protein
MGGTGFEPVKAEPSDLQSDPFDRSGNPPSHDSFALATKPCQDDSHKPIGFPKLRFCRLLRRSDSHESAIFKLAEGLEPTTC